MGFPGGPGYNYVSPETIEAVVEFGFNEEQLMIQDVARRIAQDKIAPSAEHHDRTGEFPLDNIRLLGENGRASCRERVLACV